jgi:hypothetical protein
MEVQFVANVAPIMRDAKAARTFYAELSADVEAAAAELEGKATDDPRARTEPWTQITAQLLSPEGLLVAVCYTPQFHDRSEPGA